MLHSTRLALSALVTSAFVLGGCSFNPDFRGETSGSEGKLTFQYVTSSCPFGCGVDHSVVEGSRVAVTVAGSDGAVRTSARLVGSPIGSIASQEQRCSCDGPSDGRSSTSRIEPGATCPAQTTRSCTTDVDIETTQSGDATLEIVDASGTRIDSAPIHVHRAARIDVDVREGARLVGGIYEVKQGSKIKLGARVFDGDGTELLFSQHGVVHTYGDLAVVKPDAAVLVGATDVEDMIAGSKSGETTVTVTAPGAVNVVHFRVVP